MWTKEKIHSLLSVNDKAVIRAVFAIQARQTASEQATHSTKESNGVGWSMIDAEWMGSMIKNVQRYGSLTPKQMAITRNKVKRYHRQLIEIAAEKGRLQESSLEAAVPDVEADAVRAELEEARLADHEVRSDMARRSAKEEWEARAGQFS